MSKGLDALENIKREVDVPYFSTLYDIDMWVEDITTIEKELKALEIIKNKGVDIATLMAQNTLYSYNAWANCHPNNIYGRKQLTQEEYELLKEVLL